MKAFIRVLNKGYLESDEYKNWVKSLKHGDVVRVEYEDGNVCRKTVRTVEGDIIIVSSVSEVLDPNTLTVFFSSGLGAYENKVLMPLTEKDIQEI